MKRLVNSEYESIILLKENTDEGFCFYNENMDLLVGPIKHPKVEYIDDASCYIFENHGEIVTGVYYILEEIGNDKVVVKNINTLFFFSEDGKINFSTFGHSCVVDYSKDLIDGSKEIYIIRNYKNELTIFSNKHNRVF